MKRAKLILAILLSPIVGLAQPAASTVPVPVTLVSFFGLTTTTVIDNRSPTTRFSNIHTFQASGTGTWTAQLQYSTATTGPWTNFSDPTSVISNTSPASTGGAYGYHPFIRILITGTASVNYSGTKNLYIPFGSQGGTGSGPLLQTNGSTNINQAMLNITNSAAFNGLTVTATNPTGGIVQLGLSGTLGNAGLTNSSISFTVPSWLTQNGPTSLGGTLAITPTTGQTAGLVIGTCGVATTFAPCQLVASDITTALSTSTQVNGTTIPNLQTLLFAGGPLGVPSSGNGANLVGIPLGTGIVATFTPPLSLTGNVLSAPTAVTAVSPGLGIAHFAGGTQAVTSSLVSLTADVTGVLPPANLPIATSSSLGVVQTDGSTLSISGGGLLSCTTATTAQIGCVKPDGSTITISAGVITANVTGMSIGGAVAGGASGNVLYVAPGPVLAQEVTLGAARFPALNGDVSTPGGSLTSTVVGLNNVPFCSGYSPTTGQAVEYITSGSPNPCYSSITITGGGNVSSSGTPAQFQIPVWVSSTTIGGIAPSATVGVPLISQGAASNPVFGALNLAGGSSIVTGITPGTNGGTGINNGTSTLSYAGNVAFTGPFTFAATLTGNTNVTFPTSGTLSTTTGTVTGVTFTGGIISVATGTTTPALTVAGTSGGIPCFTSTSAWASSSLLVSGQFMLGGGAGTCPSTSFSIVPLASGGTAASLAPSNGGLVYSTASALAVLAGTATANRIPLSGASAAPAWSTATYPATTTANQILYSSAANTITGLGTLASGVLVTSAGSVPSISTTLPSGLAMGTPASINLSNATAYPVATGSTFGIVKPDNTTITVVAGVISSSGGTTSATFTLGNAGTTGTTSGTLTKAVAGTAVIAATTDTNGIIGITTAGAGTTGNATITYAGAVSCIFDGATTGNDYVIVSTITAGNCHDAGVNPPIGRQSIGRVWGTNGSAGTYTIDLFPASTPPIIAGTGITLTASAAGIAAALDTSFAPSLTTLLACPMCISATGSSSGTLVASLGILTTYTNNQFFQVMITDGPSHGGDNLNINMLGPIAIFKMVGTTATAIAAGDIQQDKPTMLRYTACGIGCSGGSGGSAGFLFTPDGLSSGSGVSSLTGDGSLINNSASTGAVTLTLATAGAYNVWYNNTNATATPGYHTLINAALPGAGCMTLNGTSACLNGTYTISGGSGGGGGSTPVPAPSYTGIATPFQGPLAEYTASGVLNSLPYAAFCGTTATCSNANPTGVHMIFGSVPLVSGTPSAATITGLSPAFTSTSSYACVLTEGTAPANGLLSVTKVSGSSFTITGPNSITDTISYMCLGS